MKTLMAAASALVMLASGAAVAQNNAQGTAGNGGFGGSSNCPETRPGINGPLSQKRESERDLQYKGMTGGYSDYYGANDYTGSIAPAGDRGAFPNDGAGYPGVGNSID